VIARLRRRQRLLSAGAAALLLLACDPVQGSGSGDPPDPGQFLTVSRPAQAATLTLVAGYPATDNQFNFDGYSDGTLAVVVPVGWVLELVCRNRGTVPNSCTIVTSGRADAPAAPTWSTPDPRRGMKSGASATFLFMPTASGVYRIASLVPGHEASGMWASIAVIATGTPAISARS